MNKGHLREVTFPLLILLGQDVAFVRLLALDLAGSSKLESLLGAGLGLHLRHGLCSC